MNIEEHLEEKRIEMTNMIGQQFTLRGLEGCDPIDLFATVKVLIYEGTATFVRGGPMWARLERQK